MKVYAYTELAVPARPVARPTTLEYTENPAEADAFVVLVELGDVERRHPQRADGVLPTLARLPTWEKHERRHVLWMHSDEDAPIGTQAVVFRQSVDRRRRDPNTVPWPPAVDDFGRLAGMDYEQLLYHVGFVGLDSDPRDIRRRCLESLRACPTLNCYLDVVDRHWGRYEGTPEGDRRRRIFIDALKQSRLVLAPRGAGQHSYRLFEAMSAGRVPVVLADDYALPMSEFVDWDACSFRVPEARASSVAEEIMAINERCRPKPCMREMAHRARQAWADWLAPARWDDMVLKYLERML